jgi:hypothetical protein
VADNFEPAADKNCHHHTLLTNQEYLTYISQQRTVISETHQQPSLFRKTPPRDTTGEVEVSIENLLHGFAVRIEKILNGTVHAQKVLRFFPLFAEHHWERRLNI